MSIPPPGGSTRITAAPNAASVAPPSGAATNAESSMMRSPARIGAVTALQAQDLPRSLGYRQVHELAGSRLRRGASRLLECPQHLPRPFQLFRCRREHLVDDRHLAWVDGRLAEEPKSPRGLGLPPEPIVIGEQRMYAVAGLRFAGRAGGDDEVRACIERFLLTARDAKVGREVQPPIRQQCACGRGG